MTAAKQKALTSYRRRLKREGLVRLEVHVRQDDAVLIKGVAQALRDPNREGETRAALRQFGPPPRKSFKQFLSEAPLDRVDLTRAQHREREVDL
jgi:hypothetical protein